MGFLDSFKKMFSSQEQEDRISLSRKVQGAPNDPQARQKLGICHDIDHDPAQALCISRNFFLCCEVTMQLNIFRERKLPEKFG